MLNRLIEYVAEDPFRVLYFLGGAGGVYFWFDKWFNRYRVRATYIEESHDALPQNEIRTRADFELTNLGPTRISLDPDIGLNGMINETEHSLTMRVMRGTKRELEPHVPVRIAAECITTVGTPFLWYRRYRFTFTRGRPAILRVRDSKNAPMSQLEWIRDRRSMKRGKLKNPALVDFND